MDEYDITPEKAKNILLSIKVEDFCYSVQNKNSGQEHETLYVFVPQISMQIEDDEDIVIDIYTKTCIKESKFGKNVVVISFHKRNKPITYLFR